jgi:hypothetical protein
LILANSKAERDAEAVAWNLRLTPQGKRLVVWSSLSFAGLRLLQLPELFPGHSALPERPGHFVVALIGSELKGERGLVVILSW